MQWGVFNKRSPGLCGVRGMDCISVNLGSRLVLPVLLATFGVRSGMEACACSGVDWETFEPMVVPEGDPAAAPHPLGGTPVKLPKFSGTTLLEPYLAQFRLVEWHNSVEWKERGARTPCLDPMGSYCLEISLYSSYSVCG